jgi:hypothetical protein
MSYAQFGTIQASDYNSFVGANPGTTANVLNTVWSTGGGGAGYGQTAEANVAVGDTVTAAKWANLITKTANSASHQSSSITAVTAPASGNTITYNANVVTNLQTIYTNRLNAGTQGGTTSNSIVYGSTWTTALTFTHTVTFANGDAARYFFNSGGQLKLTCSHANSTAGINLLFNGLASNVGTVVMSAPTSGTATISGTAYTGIYKIGSGGNTPTILPNNGYYALTTSNANVFTQTASTGPGDYLATFIRVIAKSNGTQGSNGDTGSVVTLYTVWDEVPDGGLVVGTGSTVTVTAQAPEVTYLANSWGTISIAGSATGS